MIFFLEGGGTATFSGKSAPMAQIRGPESYLWALAVVACSYAGNFLKIALRLQRELPSEGLGRPKIRQNVAEELS